MNFTAALASAVKQLIAEVDARTTIRKVLGHNDYTDKACPGFEISASGN